jgi:hypothetical protein
MGMARPHKSNKGYKSRSVKAITAPATICGAIVKIGEITRPPGVMAAGGFGRRSKIKFQYMKPVITTDQFIRRYSLQSNIE